MPGASFDRVFSSASRKAGGFHGRQKGDGDDDHYCHDGKDDPWTVGLREPTSHKASGGRCD